MTGVNLYGPVTFAMSELTCRLGLLVRCHLAASAEVQSKCHVAVWYDFTAKSSRLLRQTHTHANAPGFFRSLQDVLVHLLFSRNRSKSPGVFLQISNDTRSRRQVRQNSIAEVTENVQQYQNYFLSNVIQTGSNY